MQGEQQKTNSLRRMPTTGEPAPLFVVRSPANERYHFDTVAGRYTVLSPARGWSGHVFVLAAARRAAGYPREALLLSSLFVRRCRGTGS